MRRTIEISRRRPPKPVRRPRVFVSYRFADREFVDSFIRLLKREGFDVITGKPVSGKISEAIRRRIKQCNFFVALVTRDEAKVDGGYTASPWVIAETGAAYAFRKPIVLMVQEGVTKIDDFLGDLQQLRFTDERFLDAALDAVEQLESYSAEPISRGA